MINRRRFSRDKSGVQGPEFSFPTNVYDYNTTTPRMSTNYVRFRNRFLTVSPTICYDIYVIVRPITDIPRTVITIVEKES